MLHKEGEVVTGVIFRDKHAKQILPGRKIRYKNDSGDMRTAQVFKMNFKKKFWYEYKSTPDQREFEKLSIEELRNQAKMEIYETTITVDVEPLKRSDNPWMTGGYRTVLRRYDRVEVL